MPSKRRRSPARGETRKVKAGAATSYTISAPNPYYEGRYLDGAIRFIEGKARITDAQARALRYRDGTSQELVPFENAEALVRYFMDLVGNNAEEPTRQFRASPPLRDLAEEATRVAPHFERNMAGSGESQYVDVTPRPDAPEWARTSPAQPDEYNPNLGRTRKERIRRQRAAADVRAKGVPDGADQTVTRARIIEDKEAVPAT